MTPEERPDPLDQLPIGIFRLDPALERLYANQRFSEYTGMRRGWMDVAELRKSQIPEDLRKRFLQAVREVLASGKAREVEFAFESARGARSINLRIALERDAAGAVAYVTGVAFDITRTKRLEDALRESEDRFKAFMDHTPNIAWIKDETGRYVFANKAYEWRFGFAEDEWRGQTDFELWPREFAEACRQDELSVLDSGRPLETVGVAPRKDGESRDWHLVRFPFRDSNGRRYIGGVATDVTERRKLERALRDSEERLKGLVDNSPVIVWMKDADGRYVYLSRSFENRFGVSLDKWRGKTDFDFWSAEEAERFKAADREVITSGRTAESVEAAPDRTGLSRYWWVFKFPFQNAAGERFVGGVGVDITERRRAEEEVRLQSLTDDLTGLYNRRGFLMLAEQAHKRTRRQRITCQLFFLDLDGLKQINDQHGHDQGDNALAAASEVLRVSFRESDIIGRLGGDEFAVLALDCADAEPLLARVQANLDHYNSLREAPYLLSFSVGAVRVDPEAASVEGVVARADELMYASKRLKSA